MIRLLLVLLALTTSCAFAQTVPVSAALTISWAPPTTTISTTGATTKTTFSALVGQTLYVYVTAVDSSGQSVLSAPATYVVPAQGFAPDSPTQVSVTVVITT